MTIRQFFIASALCISTFTVQAELVVVTHPGNTINTLPLSQLNRIFLGQSSSYANGSRAIALDVNDNSRTQFYREILGKEPGQIEKYWMRMIFTGKAHPPREVKLSEVKSVVAETPGAIAYLEKSQVDASVKVLKIEARQ